MKGEKIAEVRALRTPWQFFFASFRPRAAHTS
jgi:hypothetical protein